MDSLIPILIVAVLILLNGLFVAAEFAIVGVSRAEIEPAARAGSRAATLVRTVLADPRRQDRYIATAQLGITAASLGLGMYGEHMLARWLELRMASLGAGSWLAAHAIASALAVTILTYFHIVIGEMIPKALALQRARDTAIWIAPLMRGVELTLYPLVLALSVPAAGFLLRTYILFHDCTHGSFMSTKRANTWLAPLALAAVKAAGAPLPEALDPDARALRRNRGGAGRFSGDREPRRDLAEPGGPAHDPRRDPEREFRRPDGFRELRQRGGTLRGARQAGSALVARLRENAALRRRREPRLLRFRPLRPHLRGGRLQGDLLRRAVGPQHLAARLREDRGLDDRAHRGEPQHLAQRIQREGAKEKQRIRRKEEEK